MIDEDEIFDTLRSNVGCVFVGVFVFVIMGVIVWIVSQFVLAIISFFV